MEAGIFDIVADLARWVRKRFGRAAGWLAAIGGSVLAALVLVFLVWRN